MKAKKPTRAERAVILSYGLNPNNWFVGKKKDDRLTLIHRFTDQTRQIPDEAVKKLG
ncbi:DUF6906 family protein [Domibacillus antri]|uniref:DUF6906 family protein n=1 Tax=Domibacillus antri TaxID=1714264 RepID=UPI000A602909|nr:hypothetical protein [Domibacillus antri]